MQFNQLTQILASNAERIRLLAADVSEEQARWKPEADSWSILEVVNHLLDEEKEDFRVRLDIILHRPDERWPAIDPQGWVQARGYNQRDMVASLADFLEARLSSLAWLKTLPPVDWEAPYAAPFGEIRAGDMIASWVAHDQLHMRQLVELHRAYLLQAVEPFEVGYAGPW